MTRATRPVLKVGIRLERHERGQPRESGEVVNLHRKDRIAEIKIDGRRRQVPFTDLSAHWQVIT